MDVIVGAGAGVGDGGAAGTVEGGEVDFVSGVGGAVGAATENVVGAEVGVATGASDVHPDSSAANRSSIPSLFITTSFPLVSAGGVVNMCGFSAVIPAKAGIHAVNAFRNPDFQHMFRMPVGISIDLRFGYKYNRLLDFRKFVSSPLDCV